MARSITIPQMVKGYFNNIPGHRAEASFVEYAGNATIYMYLASGLRVVYSYKDDIVKGVEVDVNYMKDLKERWDVKTEKQYRAAFSYLLRGRMDALEVSAEELAKRCNISESTIHRILNKQVTPSGFTVYILEKNLQNSQNDIWCFL